MRNREIKDGWSMHGMGEKELIMKKKGVGVGWEILKCKGKNGAKEDKCGPGKKWIY